jgi:hypothetical protein
VFWSLAPRRDRQDGDPSVYFLADALQREGSILTTGLILQELLQGFSGPKARTQILERFTPLPFIVPQREDHIAAADLRNECRRRGLQIGTIDALLAQLYGRSSRANRGSRIDASSVYVAKFKDLSRPRPHIGNAPL